MRLKRVLFLVLVLFCATIAFAVQDAPPEPAPPAIDWMVHLGVLINMVSIPLLYQVLKNLVLPKTPSWIKTIAAVASGAGFTMLEQWIFSKIGIAVDFSSIVQLLTAGGGVGLASAVAFQIGQSQERAKASVSA